MSNEAPTRASQAGIAATVRQRLIRGFGASAISPIVTLLIQIVKVPIFLHIWGPALYGEWLIMSAIPTYLALSDIGFGNVASSDMTMSVAAGRRKDALDTFQSTWVLVGSISMAMMAVISIIAWFIPWQSWMKLSVMSNHGAAQIMLVFSAYALFSLQNGLIDSAFRCDGNYALGTTCIGLLRLIEDAIATIPLLLGRSPLSVAATYLCVRVIGCIAMACIVRRKSPWIRYGTKHANLSTIRRLVSPAFAFMAFPIGNAISLQGFTVVIAAVLGPVAVVAFSTMRTLSRVGFQLLNVIARAVWPELSAAFGAGDIILARNLHRRACQIAVILSAACCGALALTGPHVYASWTRHAVHFNPVTFNILLLVVLANAFWYTSSVVPMASNQHEKIALRYLIGTFISFGLAWLLMKPFGITGAALALLSIDCSMIWLVMSVALQLLSDTPAAFLHSILSGPSLTPLWRLVRGDACES